jgi:hypothetical protein
MKIRIRVKKFCEPKKRAIWIGRESDDFKIYAFNEGTSKDGRP